MLRRAGVGARPYMVNADFGIDIRCDRIDSRLPRRIHAVGHEVLDFAVHQQAQRATAIRFAEIESQAVRPGKSFERQDVEMADVFVRQKIGQQVVAFVVPGAGGRLRVAAGDDLEFRIGRIACGLFGGINVFVGRMIDGHKLDGVDVDDLFHGFHEEERENSLGPSAADCINACCINACVGPGALTRAASFAGGGCRALLD